MTRTVALAIVEWVVAFKSCQVFPLTDMLSEKGGSKKQRVEDA